MAIQDASQNENVQLNEQNFGKAYVINSQIIILANDIDHNLLFGTDPIIFPLMFL